MSFFTTVSKTALAVTLGTALVNMGACDKEELDRTKDQLAKVSSERDQLKGQVTTMQASMDSMKKDLDDAKAQIAKCTPAAPAAEPVAPAQPEPAKGGAHPAHATKGKPGAPAKEKLPVAAKPDNNAPVGSTANPIKVPDKPGGSY